MSEAITNPSYEEWVRLVFDHPAGESNWYHRPDSLWIDISPSLCIEYMTRLFLDGERALKPYSDGQLSAGFWYLIDSGGSGHALALRDSTVPEKDRLLCVEAIPALFHSVFAKRCNAHLGHLSETDSPLDTVCYMWWDVLPIHGSPANPEWEKLDRAILDAMAEILKINHDACRESALHGLGHWALEYQEAAAEIISEFLRRSGASLRPELRQYAIHARKGCVN